MHRPKKADNESVIYSIKVSINHLFWHMIRFALSPSNPDLTKNILATCRVEFIEEVLLQLAKRIKVYPCKALLLVWFSNDHMRFRSIRLMYNWNIFMGRTSGLHCIDIRMLVSKQIWNALTLIFNGDPEHSYSVQRFQNSMYNLRRTRWFGIDWKQNCTFCTKWFYFMSVGRKSVK